MPIPSEHPVSDARLRGRHRGRRAPLWFLVALGAMAALLVACDRGEAPAEPAAEPEPEPAEPAEAPAPPPPAADEAPAGDAEEGPTAAGDGYQVEATLAGPYASGEVGSFAVALEAKEEWHLNEDYPTSVTVQGPDALAFPQDRLAKADAAEWGEHAARFDVPFTPGAAGEHTVRATVKFAICTDETCIPTERTLALALPVE